METLFRDLIQAFRMRRRSPGFSATAISALALGIGAGAATFWVVNAVLLKPLPFPHPESHE
jgi:putative ABC transport system permease protein